MARHPARCYRYCKNKVRYFELSDDFLMCGGSVVENWHRSAKLIASINESAGEVLHAGKHLFLGLDLITGIFSSFSRLENHETLDGLALV